jgi:hypothetical protein
MRRRLLTGTAIKAALAARGQEQLYWTLDHGWQRLLPGIGA